MEREEVMRLLRTNEPKDVARALYSASRHDSDWRWVQDECLFRTGHSDLLVRWAAVTCLGDLAFRRFPLERTRVIAALEAARFDATIADPAEVSLGMVKEFV